MYILITKMFLFSTIKMYFFCINDVKMILFFSYMFNFKQYACFETFPFRQKFLIFFCQTMWFWWNGWHWTSVVNIPKKNSNLYVAF